MPLRVAPLDVYARLAAVVGEEEATVADVSGASRSSALLRVLCLVVLLGMLVAVGYVAWIATLNYSRIAV